MNGLTKPKSIIQECGYCGGCGHGVIQRLIAESLEELGLENQVINVVDIACCFWSLDALNYDGIAGPHGRCAAVASAIKKVRPDKTVYIHAGDGASYGIGLSETLFAAVRDIPVTMVVVNNGIFGMTGGQMSVATTPLGEKTTSSRSGRNKEKYGEPVDFLSLISQINIQYAARGALYDVKEINKTKSYIKKGLQNQMENKGFSIIEVLSPCPTNWGMTAPDAQKKIKEKYTQVFPVKVFKDRGGEENA